MLSKIEIWINKIKEIFDFIYNCVNFVMLLLK